MSISIRHAVSIVVAGWFAVGALACSKKDAEAGTGSSASSTGSGSGTANANAAASPNTAGTATTNVAAAKGPPSSCKAMATCSQYSADVPKFKDACTALGFPNAYKVPAEPCPTEQRLATCVITDAEGNVETKTWYSTSYETKPGSGIMTTWTMSELRGECRANPRAKDNKYVFTELAPKK